MHRSDSFFIAPKRPLKLQTFDDADAVATMPLCDVAKRLGSTQKPTLAYSWSKGAHTHSLTRRKTGRRNASRRCPGETEFIPLPSVLRGSSIIRDAQ